MALLKIKDVCKRTEEAKVKNAEEKTKRLEQYFTIVEKNTNEKIEESIAKGLNSATVNILPEETKRLFEYWILPTDEAIQAFINKLEIENYKVEKINHFYPYIHISW